MTENMAKLVAALKSGEYEQGVGRLRTRSGAFCCLGVACDVFSRDTGRGKWRLLAGDWEFKLDSTISTSFLPPEVSRWLGINSENGALIHGDGKLKSLVNVNDTSNNFDGAIAEIERGNVR